MGLLKIISMGELKGAFQNLVQYLLEGIIEGEVKFKLKCLL